MQVFILFQTDIWKTRSSRVCCGVFESKEIAEAEADIHCLYSSQSDVQIVETTLNELVEL